MPEVEIEAVVFDIGDVLEVNPPTGWRETWARRLRLDPPAFSRRLDEIWAPGAVGAATLAEVEHRTAAAFGLDPTALGALMDDAWREYVGHLNDELVAYARRLRPRFRTGILSNSFVGAREREEALYRFSEICDVIVYSHEVGYLKPQPAIYRLVCDRLAVAPGAAVLLDDRPENIDGARAVGMRGVVFQDTAQAIAELDALLPS